MRRLSSCHRAIAIYSYGTLPGRAIFAVVAIRISSYSVLIAGGI